MSYTFEVQDTQKQRKEWIRLFKRAKKKIEILEGEPNIFDEQIRAVLGEAHRKGVRIEIIFGPRMGFEKEFKELIKLENRGILALYFLNKRPTGHFVLVDGNHSRVERMHMPRDQEISASTTYNTLILGEKFEIEFTKKKCQALRI